MRQRFSGDPPLNLSPGFHRPLIYPKGKNPFDEPGTVWTCPRQQPGCPRGRRLSHRLLSFAERRLASQPPTRCTTGRNSPPCRSSHWGFHPIPPPLSVLDAGIKRLLINVPLETGFITLLHLSAGVGSMSLIWKHPVSKTAGATICQQHVRAARCAARAGRRDAAPASDGSVIPAFPCNKPRRESHQRAYR